MLEFKVLRSFRVPKNGGVRIPFRQYEAGTQVSTEDMKSWDLDEAALLDELSTLVTNGYLVQVTPAEVVTKEVMADPGEVEVGVDEELASDLHEIMTEVHVYE